jgi:hypothetical protein
MFNNIGGSSAAPHSYHSEANDQAPGSYDAPYESRRSSNDTFSSLAPRRDAVSEFGSVASQELLGDYHAPYYHDPSIYRQWSGGARARSDSSPGSFASADDRSPNARSSAGSGTSSHLPPSPASTSTVSSLHSLSDIGQAPSEAGSRHASEGHLSSHSSDGSSRSWASLSRHQDRLPSISDGSISPERAELLERLNRAREGFSVPADHPSVSWQPDTDLTVDDIHLSTPVTAGPPSRRPPPVPSRRRNSEIDSQSDASAAPSRFRPSVTPRVHGPAIYGRQPALSRAWNALTNWRRRP